MATSNLKWMLLAVLLLSAFVLGEAAGKYKKLKEPGGVPKKSEMTAAEKAAYDRLKALSAIDRMEKSGLVGARTQRDIAIPAGATILGDRKDAPVNKRSLRSDDDEDYYGHGLTVGRLLASAAPQEATEYFQGMAAGFGGSVRSLEDEYEDETGDWSYDEEDEYTERELQTMNELIARCVSQHCMHYDTKPLPGGGRHPVTGAITTKRSSCIERCKEGVRAGMTYAQVDAMHVTYQ